MSAPLIIAGDPGPIDMPLRTVWRITDGYSFERRWWGAAATVFALSQNKKSPIWVGAISAQFDQQPGSPIGILTIGYSGKPFGDPAAQPAVTERMTLKASDQTVKIDRNPSFIDITSTLIQEMETQLKAGAPNTQPANSASFDYYSLRSRGRESYRVKMPIVNYTRVVGSQYPVKLDLDLMGRVLTTSELADEVGDPTLWDIPAVNVGVIAPTSSADDFIVGWFMDVEMDYTGDGQIQLTINGEFGLWDSALYTVAE